MTRGRPHHVELWVPSLDRAERSWGWHLTTLGYSEHQRWGAGVSWILDGTYVVVEQSPALAAGPHDRLAPGLNHLAFHGGTRAEVDRIVEAAPAHGWTLLFTDKHPYAGGSDHYAAYLENEDGYEAEVVAG